MLFMNVLALYKTWKMPALIELHGFSALWRSISTATRRCKPGRTGVSWLIDWLTDWLMCGAKRRVLQADCDYDCIITNAKKVIFTFFFTRATLSSAVLAMERWLAGWVSVTRLYCVKTAKPIFKTLSTIW